MMPNSYRLVTRCDFDGLGCAVLLHALEMVADVAFVHPKDVQDSRISINQHDITTNLPYCPGVHLAFDRHESEALRSTGARPNHVLDPEAPSTTHIVHRHFGGVETFADIDGTMLAAIDKAYSAQFTQDEILNPSGWDLLHFMLDPRTGLERFQPARQALHDMELALIDACVKQQPLDELLALPALQERIELYRAHADAAREQIRRCARLHGKVVVLDLRAEDTIYATNRFMVYALFPQANLSIHVIPGFKNQNVVLALGKSIFDRSNPTDLAALMLKFRGGGLVNAGTCQVPDYQADSIVRQLLQRIQTEAQR
jgi:nanoRNase/pAp phosphatase (c-di-AMP/oligoRNAs hydrolase)